MFVPAAKAPPEAGAKELSYKSLNLAYSGQHPFSDQTDLFSFATYGDEYGVPRKALLRKQANVDPGHQILPGLAQGSFQIETLDRTTKTIAQINADWKMEKAQYAEFNAPTCDNVTRLQFGSCAKEDSLCGTVLIYDCLKLTCLDQCHCVRSHSKSSSQSWRKRIVIQQPEFSL